MANLNGLAWLAVGGQAVGSTDLGVFGKIDGTWVMLFDTGLSTQFKYDSGDGSMYLRKSGDGLVIDYENETGSNQSLSHVCVGVSQDIGGIATQLNISESSVDDYLVFPIEALSGGSVTIEPNAVVRLVLIECTIES